MLGSIARTLFGSSNDRYVKSLRPIVNKINALEPQIQALSDDDLARQTVVFRERLANGETLDALLPEAFATVREAARRVLGQRHYDVQMVGGIVLHRGEIAEMRTGEGKTLVATLATYLNALPGTGVTTASTRPSFSAFRSPRNSSLPPRGGAARFTLHVTSLSSVCGTSAWRVALRAAVGVGL